MKKLLDDSPDELTRSLLLAGIEDGPAPGNKARVIAALGAGGALGLFSSNAFAWLGTTAGKLTAAGVTVGVAGALFVAVPYASQGVRAPDTAGTVSRAAARDTAQVQPTPSSVSRDAEIQIPGSGASESAAARGQLAETASPATAPETNEASAASAEKASATSPAVKAATRRLAMWRERRLLARKRAAARTSPSELAVAAVTTAAATTSEDRPAALASDTALGTVPVSPGDRVATADGDLDSEVRLVDDMHRAARHNDREALGRFVERYREVFPHGQLEKEVAEFAARLEHVSNSPAP